MTKLFVVLSLVVLSATTVAFILSIGLVKNLVAIVMVLIRY